MINQKKNIINHYKPETKQSYTIINQKQNIINHYKPETIKQNTLWTIINQKKHYKPL